MARSTALLGCAIGLTLAAGVPSAAASGRDPAPAPLATTISGGGTKGAYMAGHLYYMGQLGRISDRLQPRVFTGASAGAINALVAILSACSPAEPNPRKSLYWEAWTTIGINQLFVPDKTAPDGVLTIDAYTPFLARARKLWDAGLPRTCDVLFGAALTRASARTVVLALGMPPLPVSRETVLVRITGHGPGRPPQVSNVVDPKHATGRLLLPLDGTDSKPFDALRQVVLASAAFPMGFSPVKVRHCLQRPGVPDQRCAPADGREALFVDGGVFDNQPLSLAVAAMRQLDPAAPGLPTNARFYLVDPRVRGFPAPTPPTIASGERDVLSVVNTLLGLISSGTARELIATFETEPAVRERLLLATTFYPQVSSTFTGLLDAELRKFDFYLGMYNAARSVRENALGANVREVDDILLAEADPDLQEAWRPYRCLRAVLDGVGDPSSCDGAALTDFRILLQLTVDRLHDLCLRAAEAATMAGGSPPTTTHAACKAALEGEPAPAIAGVRVVDAKEKRQRDGEGAFDHQLRMLGRYGFHFRDLGLSRADADQARDQVIRFAHRVMQRFSDVQPRMRWAMGVLSRIGVDVGLGYLPPQHSFHLSLGLGAELGHSFTAADRDWSWLRFAVALGFDGLSTILNPSDDYLAIIPKAGVEFELLGRAEVQLRLGVRAGYQFSTGDDFLQSACAFGQESSRPCSRFVTDAYLAASLFGLVRLQVAGVFAPGLRSGQSAAWAVRPTVGVQLNSPF